MRGATARIQEAAAATDVGIVCLRVWVVREIESAPMWNRARYCADT